MTFNLANQNWTLGDDLLVEQDTIFNDVGSIVSTLNGNDSIIGVFSFDAGGNSTSGNPNSIRFSGIRNQGQINMGIGKDVITGSSSFRGRPCHWS
jgi:hypothetical protein